MGWNASTQVRLFVSVKLHLLIITSLDIIIILSHSLITTNLEIFIIPSHSLISTSLENFIIPSHSLMCFIQGNVDWRVPWTNFGGKKIINVFVLQN